MILMCVCVFIYIMPMLPPKDQWSLVGLNLSNLLLQYCRLAKYRLGTKQLQKSNPDVRLWNAMDLIHKTVPQTNSPPGPKPTSVIAKVGPSFEVQEKLTRWGMRALIPFLPAWQVKIAFRIRKCFSILNTPASLSPEPQQTNKPNASIWHMVSGQARPTHDMRKGLLKSRRLQV